VEEVLTRVTPVRMQTLEGVLAADAEARAVAEEELSAVGI
jgi:hypothetical protein